MEELDPLLRADILEFCHRITQVKVSGKYMSQASVTRLLQSMKEFSRFKRNDPDFADALPNSYDQLEKILCSTYGSMMYTYDVCPDCCSCVYRCETAKSEVCPRCNGPRYIESTRTPRMTMEYLPLTEYITALFRDRKLRKELKVNHQGSLHYLWLLVCKAEMYLLCSTCRFMLCISICSLAQLLPFCCPHECTLSKLSAHRPSLQCVFKLLPILRNKLNWCMSLPVKMKER